ncbi:MAG: hypothetical protein WDN04_04000 [Rhodospirillales bacterium]
MDKADMKRLLARSRKEPVNCAVAQPKKGAMALLLMDKVKQPKALVKNLMQQFDDLKNPRFGTVSVDAEDDPKVAVFELNKAFSGLQRRLVKTLKGTGITGVDLK